MAVGLSVALLNGWLILQFDRRADALIEGLFLVFVGFALTLIWIELRTIREQYRHLHLLHRLSEAVNTPFRVEDILKAAIDELVEGLNVDAGGIGLLDSQDGVTVSIQAEHLQRDMLPSVGQRLSLDPGSAPWAEPLWRNKVVVVEDVQATPSVAGLEGVLERRETRAVLLVPLFADGKLLGTLGLHSRAPRRFSNEETEAVLAAASIVSNAVAKATRLREAQRRAAHLAIADAVAQRLIGDSDIGALPQHACDALARHFPDWSVYIFLLEAETETLVLKGKATHYPSAAEAGFFRIRLGEGLVGRAASERTHVLVNDVRADPGYISRDPISVIRAELAVPIVFGNQLLGALDIQSARSGEFTVEDALVLRNVTLDVGAALANARLIGDLKNQIGSLRRMQEASLLALASDSLEATLPKVCAATASAVGAYQASIMLIDAAGYCYRWTGNNYPTLLGPHAVRPQGISMTVLRSATAEFIPDLEAATERVNPRMLAEGVRAAACLPLSGRAGPVGVMWIVFQERRVFTELERGVLSNFSSQAGLAIERLTLYVDAARRLRELEAVQSFSAALRQLTDTKALLKVVLDTALQLFDTPHGDILLPDETGRALRFAAARGWPRQVADTPLAIDKSLSGRIFRTGTPLLVDNLTSDSDFSPTVAAQLQGRQYAGMFAPVRDEERIIGVIFVSCELPRHFTEEDLRLLNTLAEIAGTAFRREALRAERERQIQRLQALHEVDRAINSSLDLRLTLGVFLEQVTTQLRVDAAVIMLLDSDSVTLRYTAARGLRTNAFENFSIRLGEGLMGQAMLERRTAVIHDMRNDERTQHSPQIINEGFVAFCGLPLIAKGKIKGALGIFHRSPLQLDPDWLDFAETMAEQASIAIDNGELFDKATRSGQELTLAYDATIEGWSRAMDLRDQETEGHTQRVTELAIRLAEQIGVTGEEIAQLRRGALLHDMGKLGVPDRILLKPGPLTDEERELMRQHPQYAYDMLSPVAYLRPALDIPYCHHEKWDGTGYPRGLKGEEIPLAARLFAVADVWDALRSDRPYRAAWPRAKVIEYLREQAGTHFDARIVEAFLALERHDQ